MLCRHFMKSGQCSLNDKCHFAHGAQELRGPTSPLPTNIPPMHTKSV